jgi:electron transfer flavoprotein alpha subunit
MHSCQMLYKARELVNMDDGMISAICMHDIDDGILKLLTQHGADEVIYCKCEDMEYMQISRILDDMIQSSDNKPTLILFPATELGKCIAAHVAVKIKAGLTAECINIDSQNVGDRYQFTFTRAAVNSSILARIECINTEIGMCTCKENVFKISELFPEKQIPVLEWEIKSEYQYIDTARIIDTELAGPKKNNLALERARIVFGIGRGVKNENDLQLIKQVAEIYGAAIAGTRAVVEEGIIEKECQVGQSGISISPEIYVAISISGATQHIVGIKNSGKIISINNDPNATIFAYSDYCFVDDYRNIFKQLLITK